MAERITYINNILICIYLVSAVVFKIVECTQHPEELPHFKDYAYSQGIISAPVVSNPGKPENLRATTVVHNKIFLRWDEPSSWNGPGSGFLVKYSKLGQNTPHTINRPKSETTTMILAEIWTEYSIKVTAYNNHSGTVFESEPASLTVKTLVAAPGEPRNLTLFHSTDTTLEFEWSRPETANGPISGYEVHFSSLNGQHDGKIAVKKETAVIYHLNPWTPYTIYVHAFNENDALEPLLSEPAVIEMETKVGPPSAPVDLNITEVTKTSFYVMWNAPTTKNGPISGYTIKATGKEFKFEEDKNSYNVTIIGLKPNNVYDISVAAYNLDETTKRLGPSSVVKQQTVREDIESTTESSVQTSTKETGRATTTTKKPGGTGSATCLPSIGLLFILVLLSFIRLK